MYWQRVDRLYKTPEEAGKQKQQTVYYEVLTGKWQTVHDTNGRSDTEPINGILWGIDRHWRDCRSHQWSQWHRTNRRYSMKFWQTVDRQYKSTVGAMTQNQQTVQYEVLTDSGQTIQVNSWCSDTEPTDGTVWSSVRQWTDNTSQQLVQWHRTNRRYSMTYSKTVDIL